MPRRRTLQAFPERVRSFFHLPDIQYAAIPESALTPCPIINWRDYIVFFKYLSVR